MTRTDIGDYGTMFKTVPETTKDFANRMTCFKIPGQKDAAVAPQGVLPDLANYNVCLSFNPYSYASIGFVMMEGVLGFIQLLLVV